MRLSTGVKKTERPTRTKIRICVTLCSLTPRTWGFSPGAEDSDSMRSELTWVMASTVAATNQGSPRTEQMAMRTESTRRSRWYPHPFLSLFSLRLMMTAVICWSIKIRIVANSAGGNAASVVHHGFLPSHGISHPRPSQVGSNFWGTSSLGVSSPSSMSVKVMRPMAITTEKSLTNALTEVGK
uniref:Uncharacterized protein n=1 Tax=Ixodes ricinus TaxID=34613 RepID=A0A6B0UZQ6_IXORI